MGNNDYCYQQQQCHLSTSHVDVLSPAPIAPSPATASGPSISESDKEILFYIKVLYDCDSESDKELTIYDGGIIFVLAVSTDGWWESEMTDRHTGRLLIPIQLY